MLAKREFEAGGDGDLMSLTRGATRTTRAICGEPDALIEMEPRAD